MSLFRYGKWSDIPYMGLFFTHICNPYKSSPWLSEINRVGKKGIQYKDPSHAYTIYSLGGGGGICNGLIVWLCQPKLILSLELAFIGYNPWTFIIPVHGLHILRKGITLRLFRPLTKKLDHLRAICDRLRYKRPSAISSEETLQRIKSIFAGAIFFTHYGCYT